MCVSESYFSCLQRVLVILDNAKDCSRYCNLGLIPHMPNNLKD